MFELLSFFLPDLFMDFIIKAAYKSMGRKNINGMEYLSDTIKIIILYTTKEIVKNKYLFFFILPPHDVML
ncbi:hypothetical protein SDC9_99612 [bioreactor metagenome]|uniref:Uncharacterized protein n=1 Tax=bioreactor metagenome TaxID=1076179 RepID=A0A645AJD6_9ZZZZ